MSQKHKIVWRISKKYYLCSHIMRLIMSYLYRVSDEVLAERLEAFGAVLIEGPKWCGKTTTAEQVAKSVI